MIPAGTKKRPRFTLIVSGPAGGSRERLLETLRENGYVVRRPRVVGIGVVEVKVLAPWGEVNR